MADTTTYPVRKTTLMALNGLIMVHRQALHELAKAALEDGEAPEGYTLDVDRQIWRKPDITPMERVSAPTPEASTS